MEKAVLNTNALVTIISYENLLRHGQLAPDHFLLYSPSHQKRSPDGKPESVEMVRFRMQQAKAEVFRCSKCPGLLVGGDGRRMALVFDSTTARIVT